MSLSSINRFEAAILFVGDAIVLYLSLWLSLLLRYGNPPSFELWQEHVVPFSFIFAVWILSFFIAGLYEKHTTVLKSRIPRIILKTQITNSILALIFFYLIPYFGITPKTILFMYLIVSLTLIISWRQYALTIFGGRKQQPALLIGSGEEMHELMREVNDNPRYGMYFASAIDLDRIENLDFQGEILERVYSEGIGIVVVDTNNEKVEPILSQLYNLIFSKVRFIDMHKVYEEIFDRVPLSLVQYGWFLENISVTRRFTYEFLKRIMDILIASVLLIPAVALFPIVWLLIKFDDRGSVFIKQERIGRNNHVIHVYKVRSMSGVDVGDGVLKSEQVITRAGAVLRKTRIDELPQLWNVLVGDLSLIGPRPELPALVKHYEAEVPYYNVRHLIAPGLSGWAQMYHENHPHHGMDVASTREKLAYDLYYLSHRSLLLDFVIALKTVKTLLSRTGR